MPLTPKGLDVLSDNSELAHLALRSPSFRSLGLATDTPRIPVLLYVRHAALERITAFRAEEVAIVPMRVEGDDVLAKDRCLAVFAAWGEKLMPVEMAVEPKPVIPILRHGLAR